MKWIGQHIWDFISRFRSDVYLEGTETGTIASGGNLGLDSNNKIVKATSGSGDLTITNATDNRVVTSTGGTGLNAEAGLTFDGSVLATTVALIQQQNATAAAMIISNTGDNSTGGALTLNNTGGGVDMSDEDYLGVIDFSGMDDGTPSSQIYARIRATASDVTSGQEAGRVELGVAEYDGTVTTGLKLEGDTDADGEIDVIIGAGVASVTTIAGDLDIDGDNMTSAGAMTFTPVGKYTITAPDIAGDVFHLDADADTDNIVNIDAGSLDIDASNDIVITAADNTTIQAADVMTIETTSANGHMTLSSAHTAGIAVHIDGNADAGSIVDIDAGILDIDVTGDASITSAGGDITIATADNHYSTSIDRRKFAVTSSTDHDHNGDVVYFGGGSTTKGNICYLKNDGEWGNAQANAESTSINLLAIALGSDPDTDGMLLRGMITLDHNTDNSNDGDPLYLSDGTAGNATPTAPDSNNDVVRVIGYKLGDDDEIWFCPDNTWVTVTA